MSEQKKRKSGKSCIYCGSNRDMTTDHIPPKNLFPEPRPSNMLTVPSCKKCNKSFEKDDEYFRTVLVSNVSVSCNPNVEALREKLLRSIRRPDAEGMANAIHKSLCTAEVTSQGGIYLGQHPAMMASAKRIDREINRIAQGLFYITHGYPVPEEYKVNCWIKDATFCMPEEFIAHWSRFWKPPVVIGDNVFGYSYAPVVDDPNMMLLVYWFYGNLWFYGYVVPKSEVESTQ